MTLTIRPFKLLDFRWRTFNLFYLISYTGKGLIRILTELYMNMIWAIFNASFKNRTFVENVYICKVYCWLKKTNIKQHWTFFFNTHIELYNPIIVLWLMLFIMLIIHYQMTKRNTCTSTTKHVCKDCQLGMIMVSNLIELVLRRKGLIELIQSE